MNLIERITVGHPDGSTCTEVKFTNGVSLCSCTNVSQADAHRLAPNLRDA